MQLTIEEIKQLAGCGDATESNDSHPFEVGKNYFIRTVTHNHTGRLVAVHRTELVLEDAAWIADSGRFAQAIADGTLNEVEPFPAGAKVIIGRGAIVDAVQFANPLPRSQK